MVSMMAVAEPSEVLVPMIRRFSSYDCRLHRLVQGRVLVRDRVGGKSSQGEGEYGVDLGRIQFGL